MSQRPATPLENLAGQWLGPFQIARLLGKGAMGSVYLAKDSLLRRDVALKVLAKASGEGADEDKHDRFLREARAAARLIHPNVVQIFQVGEDEHYRYIAMEYVEGLTMRQASKQQGGRLPELLCMEKMRDAADALKLADSFGICHRDIKPANLLLTKAGALKIADFGLASQVEGSESIGPGAISRFEGTPYYMSPEQWYGGPITTSTDVYCLGATFYHLVTGQTPYPPRDLVGCFRAHTMDPVPDPREAMPEIDAEYADLLMRAMAKFAVERPNAAEVVEVLDEMLSTRLRSVRPRAALSPATTSGSSTFSPDASRGPGDSSSASRHARASHSAQATGHGTGPGTSHGPSAGASTGVRPVSGGMAQSRAGMTGSSTHPGGITRPETFGSQSYHQFFSLSSYPFSDIRQPSSFWDAPPFGSIVRTIAAQIIEDEGRPSMLLGAAGSGRTFLCEMLKNKYPELFIVTIEPQLLFGVHPLLTLCRQQGATDVSAKSTTRALMDSFLAVTLPPDNPSAIAVLVVDGLDPTDRETLNQLHDILMNAPKKRFSMILVGSEDLPERLKEVKAPRSLLAGPPAEVLRPMTPREMVKYIEFRMKTVGGSPESIELDLPSQQLLHARSGGSPKLINVFCHNALTIAALKQEKTLKLSSVRYALKSKSYLSPEAARALLMDE